MTAPALLQLSDGAKGPGRGEEANAPPPGDILKMAHPKREVT